jgi:uncharacterized protein (DUF1778 family)
MVVTSTGQRRARLSVDLDPELRKRLKLAATQQDMTMRDFVLAALRQVLADQASRNAADDGSWARLSAGAFARDWASDEDRVYDQLPPR